MRVRFWSGRQQSEVSVVKLGVIRWADNDYTTIWRAEDYVEHLNGTALEHLLRNEIDLKGKRVELYYIDAGWFGYRASRVEPALATLIANDPLEGLRYLCQHTHEEAAALIGPDEVGNFNAAERAAGCAWLSQIEQLLKTCGAQRIDLLQETLARAIARSYFVAYAERSAKTTELQGRFKGTQAKSTVELATRDLVLRNIALFVIGETGLAAIMCDEQGVISEYAEAAPFDIPTSLWVKAAFEEAHEGLSSSILEKFFADVSAVERRIYLWGGVNPPVDEALSGAGALPTTTIIDNHQTRHAAASGLWSLMCGELLQVRRGAFEHDVHAQLKGLEEALANQAAAEDRQRRRRLALSFARPLWIGASIALILVADAQWRLRQAESDLQNWRLRKTQLEGQIAEMKRDVLRLEETAALIDEISALGGRQRAALFPVEDISARLKGVDGLRVGRFAVSAQGEITIAGTARSNAAIAEAARLIEWDGSYKTPTLTTKEENAGEIQFEAHTAPTRALDKVPDKPSVKTQQAQ